MADLQHWDKDEQWTVEATFEVAGTPTNPTTVAATAYKPDGTTEAYAFPGANISNPSAGVFRVSDTGDQVGTWYIEVVGTGVAAGRARHAIVIDPRWPADLLNADALTTIERVEMLLDRAGTQGTTADEEDDKAFIAFLVNTFSEAANKFLCRQFKPVETAATKKLVYDGTDTLSLAPHEATAVTSVTFYTDRPVADQRVLVVQDEYLLEPRQLSPEGTYLAMTFPWYKSWRHLWPYKDGVQVSVLGNWGAGVVPSDVEYAVAGEAANAYMRSSQRAPRGIAAEDYFGPDVGPLSLSRRAQGILEPHSNRPRIA